MARRNKYQGNGLSAPRTRAGFFFGLTLHDLAVMAGMLVAFCGFLAIWVTLFLLFFAWLVERMA